jgi:hypothetical protein
MYLEVYKSLHHGMEYLTAQPAQHPAQPVRCCMSADTVHDTSGHPCRDLGEYIERSCGVEVR